MQNKLIQKQFFKYTIPATFSFLLTGIYSIMDGFFIGKAVGDMGLAAINIAWPLVMVMMALGTGLGMGGSVISSLYRGAKEEEKARKAEGSTITILLLLASLLMIFLWIFSKKLLSLLGASEDTFTYAYSYIHIMSYGCIFQVMSCGLIPILRNKGKTIFAMMAMVSGCICNIFFDWLFVIKFNMGMEGAALATIMGQFVTILPCAILLYSEKDRLFLSDLVPNKKILKSIFKVAISPMGITILPSITVVLTNLQILRYGNAIDVAAFAVIAYVVECIHLLIQGMSDGSQPLISLYQGAKDKQTISCIRKLTYLSTLSIAAIGTVTILLLRFQIPEIFGTSSDTSIIIAKTFPLFVAPFLLYAFTRSTTSYFYAVEKTKAASIMVYGEALLTFLYIMVLPFFFSLNGVWYTTLLTQISLCIISIWMIKKRL